MLTTHEKFRMLDKGGNNNFFIEVNWKDDERIKNCQVFRFIFPDGKTAIIDKKHLLEVLFATGAPEEQQKMIPQTIRRSRWYETVISVKAKKDIVKGENITFPLKITLPTEEEAVIAEIRKEQNTKGLLIPTKGRIK